MAKKSFSSGLMASIQAEEQSTANRFERAETFFAKPTAAVESPSVEAVKLEATPPPPPVLPKTKATESMVLQTLSLRPSDVELLDQFKMRFIEAALASDRRDAMRAASATNRSELARVAIAALDRLPPSEALDLLIQVRESTTRLRHKSL
ncbi:MAG TPA: hypothetical protein PLF26_15130 [Blastocatellia bacterium]|nr:hypothetical protein [Blastocatellia bacterium]